MRIKERKISDVWIQDLDNLVLQGKILVPQGWCQKDFAIMLQWMASDDAKLWKRNIYTQLAYTSCAVTWCPADSSFVFQKTKKSFMWTEQWQRIFGREFPDDGEIWDLETGACLIKTSAGGARTFGRKFKDLEDKLQKTRIEVFLTEADYKAACSASTGNRWNRPSIVPKDVRECYTGPRTIGGDDATQPWSLRDGNTMICSSIGSFYRGTGDCLGGIVDLPEYYAKSTIRNTIIVCRLPRIGLAQSGWTNIWIIQMVLAMPRIV